MGWTRRAGGVDDVLDDAPGARADGAQDRADDADEGEGEGGAGEAAEALPGGGRGPAACRARRDDGRRGTSPTTLSTVSLSSREPDPPRLPGRTGVGKCWTKSSVSALVPCG